MSGLLIFITPVTHSKMQSMNTKSDARGLTFAEAIKLVQHGFDIRTFPLGDHLSLFQFCQSKEEIDILIEQGYVARWYPKSVFDHIKKIIDENTDKILMRFVPHITNWTGKYFVENFDGSTRKYMNIFQIAVLLNSEMLLRKIVETAGKSVTIDVLNSGTQDQTTILEQACEIGNDEIINFLIEFVHNQIFIKNNGFTPLCIYLRKGLQKQSKKIVELLATEYNIKQNYMQLQIMFGNQFVSHLRHSLEPAKCTIDGRDIGNLVDAYGNIICKNPAELAIAVFCGDNVLQKDELKRIFVKSSEMRLTDIDGKVIIKNFINGIHIEVPIESKNDDKIRFHMLTKHNENMLVRFSKFYRGAECYEFN